MSSELYWQLVRNNNAFIVRRNGITLSREPGNLAGIHSFKYSGFAQPKTIQINLTSDGVVYQRRSVKAASGAVAKAYPAQVSTIRKQADGPTKAVKIARDLEANGYRLDLTRAAQARVCAALNSFKTRKAAPIRQARGAKKL